MVAVNDIGQALLIAVNNALIVFFTFLPRLIGALVILLIGLLAGRLVGGLVTRALRALNVHRLADRAEIDEFLRNAGVRKDAAEIVGELAKWFIYLIFFQLAADTLGISEVTAILNQIVAFIPRVVVAIIILLFGAFLANLLAGIIRGSLRASRVANAALLAAIARYGVLAFAIVAALSQLEIAPAIVNMLWTALIGGVGLGLALAFGLGARDVAASMATSQLLRADLQPGMQVGIDGVGGTVERISPLYTSVRTAHGQQKIPNVELARKTLQVSGEPAVPPLPPGAPAPQPEHRGSR